jgi:hypothetical protein
MKYCNRITPKQLGKAVMAFVASAAIACKPHPPNTLSASEPHNRPCPDAEVAVLHNPTDRDTRIFVTDRFLVSMSRVGANRLGGHATLEYGVLKAGATDTLFDVSGQKVAWSPGASFACVPRHNDISSSWGRFELPTPAL